MIHRIGSRNMEEVEKVKAEALQIIGVFQLLPKLVVFDLDYTLWPFYWFIFFLRLYHTNLLHKLFTPSKNPCRCLISVSAVRSTTRRICFLILEAFCMRSKARTFMLQLLPSHRLLTLQPRILTSSASGQCLSPRSVVFLCLCFMSRFCHYND